MNDDTHDFLTCLWPEPQAGFLTLTAVHPDRSRPSPSRHIPLGDRRQIDTALAALDEANRLGWNAFVAIASRNVELTRWRRGGYADLLMLPAVFADVDHPPDDVLFRLNALRLPPSVVVSSGRGTHAYWLLNEPTDDFEAANRVIRWLAQTLGGDRLTAAQSMRLPGTVNVKPDSQHLCRLMRLEPDRRYTLNAFPRAEPSESDRQRSTSRRVLNPDLIVAVCSVLIRDYAAYARPNGWIAALCPLHHTHDEPGKHFNFNVELGMGHCFGRHGRLLLKDLCGVLGIDPAAYGGILI